MNATADFLQAERILRIVTPLGTDRLLAEKLSWREEISALFEGQVAVRSKLADLKPDQLLGKAVDISLELGGGQRRNWNALVTDLIAGPRATRGLQSYQLVLRPELWLLSQRSDCRIWLDRSALDVAQTLLGEHSIAGPDTAGVVDPVPAQHYSVQWNETDLAYLTRRLEEDGLFYWFEHEEGAHWLHIASHAAGYTHGSDTDVRYAPGSTDRNHIERFETRFSYTPGKQAGRDWNFQTPGTVPGGEAPSLVSLPRNGQYELYQYPMQAGYGTGVRASEGIDDAQVERIARLRMQALEAGHARIEGASNVRTLAAGRRFKPYDVANPDNVFEEHVILAIEHQSVDISYESVGNRAEYSNRFLALPSKTPATPQRTTPRPRIDGTQVAIVAGPPGEEIHPDEHGRIKLWFPWDRRAKKDGSDTCWVRVSQSWAGAGWGAQVIPRIGMEAMVSYLDGDPDRPVVTGLVPNAARKVPYELPANKTRSVLRTNTHKGTGFNELRFEDKAGKEEMFLHAQRDRNEKTRRNHTERIDRNWVQSVGNHKAIEVEGCHDEVVGGNKSIHVGSLNTLSAVQFASKLDWQGIPQAAEFLGLGRINAVNKGFFTLFTERGITETSLGIKTQTIGTSNYSHAGSSQHLSAGKSVQIDGGQVASLRGGNSVGVESGGDIVVVCGEAALRLHSNGDVYLSGRNLFFDFYGDVELNSEGRISIDGNEMEQKSDTGFTIKGARVDIN